MRTRCYNTNCDAYPNYGGRGITMCDRWRKDFAAFYADMGPRPSPKLTIERKNNNHGYSPENCIWATRNVQANNTRVTPRIAVDAETMTAIEWSTKTGTPARLIHERLRKGWSARDAIFRPNRYQRRHHDAEV